ncbi:hypothetical protein [Nocardioides sp. SYSU D00038]|uniref:hypothetical protein n=1 Tax=Nocardioides sp. SYSU D00038 TaxID=2812554 RepID=UPI0019678875|nr:hypothetical protein [Nocardioides sp. SYSU D00038]
MTALLSEISALDPQATLSRAGSVLRCRRAAEVEDAEVVLHWADLHASDDGLALGGPGTPAVAEHCLAQLALARQTHPLELEAFLSDLLDLRHRLPRTWDRVRELSCALWLARKVATVSRGLDAEGAAEVDRRVVDALPFETPGQVLVEAETVVRRRLHG